LLRHTLNKFTFTGANNTWYIEIESDGNFTTGTITSGQLKVWTLETAIYDVIKLEVYYCPHSSLAKHFK